MNRRAELAKIHIAKKQLNIADADYRALLQRVAQVDSAADLNLSGLKAVIAELKRLGFQPKNKRTFSPQSRHKEHKSQADKIRALWISMHQSGIIRDGSETALNHFVRRLTGVERVEWLYPKNANRVIESLKQWQTRVEGQSPCN